MVVNGKEMNLEDGITIVSLLNKLNLNPNKVVVEVDMNIVSKEKYEIEILNNTDQVEIVNFVGGG